MEYNFQLASREGIEPPSPHVQDKNALRIYTSVVTCIVLPVELSGVQPHAQPWVQRPCRLLSLYIKCNNKSKNKECWTEITESNRMHMSPN